MSGTSVDAIDSALVSCGESGIRLLATHQHTLPAEIRRDIATLSHSGEDEIERLGVLDRQLGGLFAAAALKLLDTAKVLPEQVRAIGSHGQTVRHRPPSDASSGPHSFTLQIGDPNTIAELSGIATVADFRRRDIAAGGEGAPLAPAFHAAAFAGREDERAVVNIGGIANVTLLDGPRLRAGFDTGPGNTLLDLWVQRHRQQAYDRDGAWSALGNTLPDLLDRLLDHPYFSLSGPRSTGKETFNLAFLEQCLASGRQYAPQDVQATLAQFTAESIARALTPGNGNLSAVYVCGGGAHNGDLMRRLRKCLPCELDDTASLGIDPDWVEAAAFAWLASCTLEGLAGNAPAVTGAAGPRILGGVYSAG